MTCAFTACAPSRCALVGGCVPLRFAADLARQRQAAQAPVRAPRRSTVVRATAPRRRRA